MQSIPSLDTWTSGFLIAAAMGVFLSLMLFINSNKKNWPIAWLMLAFSAILFQYVLYWTRYETVYPYFMLLPPVCYYATGPLLYLYFERLYKREVSFNYAFHFLPAAIVLIPTLVLWAKYLGWTDQKITLLWLVQQHWFIVAHMLVYAFLCWKLLRKKNNAQSEWSQLRLQWTKVLTLLYTIFIGAYVSYYVLVNFSFFSPEWDYMISITMSVSIYAIGYFIIKQPEIFNGELYAQLFLPIKNKEETFENSLLNELFDKLTQYMDEEKPYTDNELRLVHLADQLGFSTHLLSKVINKKSGMNFNQFVNSYRLKEAKRLLSTSENVSIKSIYFDVGFNNKTTFYHAFKKKFECTPTQYRNKLLES